TYIPSLILSSSAHHPDLHSFPTRRSSDLSSALLGRMNFALALSNGKVKGIGVEPDHVLGSAPSDAEGTLAALENALLAGDVSKQTHETILKQLDEPQISKRRLDDPARPPDVAGIAGLILGSPEFQRR